MSDAEPRHSTKRIEIPTWTVDALKILSTVTITLALAYVRFSAVESRVSEHHIAIAAIQAKSESIRDAAGQLSQKVGTLEVQQTLVSGEFRDSLKRIEDDVKELKQDLKAGKVKP